jgi:hypothetical protein
MPHFSRPAACPAPLPLFWIRQNSSSNKVKPQDLIGPGVVTAV